jgi:glycine/D-amino acid oxidase-like deaminating enzyme
MPTKTSVVIIGGGIIGVSTALFLAQKGIPVVLCEKGEIGAEQSGRNWGWTRVMGRDVREIPLGLESLKLWRRMDEITGSPTGFNECGIVYLAQTQDELDHHEAWLEKARPYQVTSRMIGTEEIPTVLPGIQAKFKGALYTPTDGRAEPQKGAPAIARAAQAHGATILTRTAVRGVETKGGRISGVITERGRIDCEDVVLAGGAWSRLFTGNMSTRHGLGIDLPQLKVLGSVFRTQKLDGAPDASAGGGLFAFRKRLDGGYTIARRGVSDNPITPDSFRLLSQFLPAFRKNWRELRLRLNGRFLDEWNTPRAWADDAQSPFEQVRILDPVPSGDLLEDAKRNLAAAFPAFAGMQEAERWGGLMDVTPDAVPVISDVSALPGFWIATGFSGHGFGIGPGAGRLMADLVSGATPVVDPTPYKFSRFADGSYKQYI